MYQNDIIFFSVNVYVVYDSWLLLYFCFRYTNVLSVIVSFIVHLLENMWDTTSTFNHLSVLRGVFCNKQM